MQKLLLVYYYNWKGIGNNSAKFRLYKKNVICHRDEGLERFSFECRKVIGFALCTPHDWLKKLAPLFHPIRSKTKTNRDSFAHVFLRFASATCNYLLIGSLDCLCPLWLARVISLVLVLRHSIENRSITNEINFIFRRVPLPRHQKQRTYETTEKRIQDGKTRYMLRGVVSHIFIVIL